MNALEAYQLIRSRENLIFRTNEIAVLLKVSNAYGHKILSQLRQAGLIIHLRRDLWGLEGDVDALLLPDYLTAPFPSYISLQSALYYHGMIEQIPSIIYAVSLARTRSYPTPLGEYSIHHIKPELFCGFTVTGDHDVQLATPEKALFDFFYFSVAKSQLFCSLPELEIPKKFRWKEWYAYTERVENKSRRSVILNAGQQFESGRG
jgi:predicted transcriptional regulator of viral defense system